MLAPVRDKILGAMVWVLVQTSVTKAPRGGIDVSCCDFGSHGCTHRFKLGVNPGFHQ